MHPISGIDFVEGPMGRRAALTGSGLDVWEVIKVVNDNDGSAIEAAAYLEVEPLLIETAVRYYRTNRQEIDGWIARVHKTSKREETKWWATQLNS